MCHDIPEHSTAATLATNTGFGTHKMCAAGAHFSKRKTQIQKIIFAPKAHLHSSAKVRYLDFCVSAYSTDGDELQSDRMSGRPAPQTTSTAPQPCPTPTASSATLNISGRSHTADLALIILGDGTRFWVHKSAPQAHFFPTEIKVKFKIGRASCRERV